MRFFILPNLKNIKFGQKNGISINKSEDDDELSTKADGPDALLMLFKLYFYV